MSHVNRDAAAPEGRSRVEVSLYAGERAQLRELFEQAEDSALQLDGYIDSGRVLVARLLETIVGHAQVVPATTPSAIELKSLAVVERLRRTGIGRGLVRAVLDLARAEGLGSVVVATAAADIGNLRFYQRCGFRFEHVERDAFTPANGYREMLVDGIPLLDRVWLSQEL